MLLIGHLIVNLSPYRRLVEELALLCAASGRSSRSLELVQECKEKFSGLLRDAEAGQLNWKKGYEGLAAVILMDQFSR